MRQNEGCAAGRETVAAMDLLVPGIGEIIGGSQREERLEQLRAGMMLHHLEEKKYWWYLDLRRYGTVPHAGFGLGFERMLMFITGVANIRDVIPCARPPGTAEF
jgi:asparaginyl-tRNA synthetase